MPVSALFENLRAGASIEEFLDWFEGVDASQVQDALDHVGNLEDRGDG